MIGDYRRDCRLRELAAGRSCPRNVRSAGQTRRKSEHNLKSNPKNHLKNNKKHNAKNNPKNNLIKKTVLRTKNPKL